MKDSFKSRPAQSNKGSFEIISLCWSPESDKLAVGQSDGQIYIYRIGLGWGSEKKKNL